MSNDFFNATDVPGTGAALSSSTIRAEFSAIGSGFDKMATLTGNGSKAVVVNSAGTALTVTAAALTLAVALTTAGSGGITLRSSATTDVTLPTTGTLATLAGAETLTNKTITTFGGALTFNPANVSATLSPTGTGTVTIAPATAGTMNNMAIGGTTAAAGAFTTGTFSSTLGVTGNFAVNTNKFTVTASSGDTLVAGDLTVSGSITSAGDIKPSVNDGAELGSTSLSWADLYLASGATINFANNNAVVTHSSGVITVSTGDLRVTTAGTNAASVVTVGGTQTLTNKTFTSPTIGTSPTAAGATWTDLGTVTTVDINGGTIDGATIGGASAGAGTFTTLSYTNVQGSAPTTGWYTPSADLIRTPNSVTIDDAIVASGSAGHAFGTTTSPSRVVRVGGTVTVAGLEIISAISAGVGGSGYGAFINPTITENTSGTHPVLAGLRVSPSFVNDAGATTTIAASIYVSGLAAPTGTVGASSLYIGNTATGATDNYALWGDAGALRWDGLVLLNQDGASATFINDTANANMTVGLTINQGANDNQAFAIKSSDVAHALVSGGTVAAETDDFFTVQKLDAAEGGARLTAFMEDGASGTCFAIQAFGGTAVTTDTTASTGLVNITAAEHDGANATIAAPANQNLFVIRAATGAAAYATRLLLKGDDGELHLGNTTLVALDDEDDARLARAMQKVSSSDGIVLTEYDNPFDNYDWLRSKGLVGPKDERGEFLFPLQSRLHAHEGAIWQGYVRQKNIEKEITEVRGEITRLQAIESRLAAIEHRV